MAERLAPDSLRERLPVRALVAGGAVLFNPALIALSAVWGQVDAVPAMFVLWSLLLLYTGPQSLKREIAALLIFAVAIAMKPQEGFVLPVMLYALYRRYLHRQTRRRDVRRRAQHRHLRRPRARPLGRLGPRVRARARSGSSTSTARAPPSIRYTSANAFNLWGADRLLAHRHLGARGIANFGPVWKLAGIPALYLGWLLFVAGTVLVLWQTHRAIERGAHEARTYMVGLGRGQPALVRRADAHARAVHVPVAGMSRAAGLRAPDPLGVRALSLFSM